MSITQSKMVRAERAKELQSIKAYCVAAGMRLSSDKVSGFWLHCDGTMRYVPNLGDVRGWVDYIDAPQI